MNVFFIKYRMNGKIIYCSKNIEDILGYKPEELIDVNIYEFFHPEDLIRISKAHLEVKFNPVITTETYRFRHKLGHFVWIKSYSENIDSSIVSINKKLSYIERLFFKYLRRKNFF